MKENKEGDYMTTIITTTNYTPNNSAPLTYSQYGATTQEIVKPTLVSNYAENQAKSANLGSAIAAQDVVSNYATAIWSTIAPIVAGAKAISDRLNQTGSGYIPQQLPTQLPAPLRFNPNLPIINGIQINKVQVKIGNPIAGNRADIIAQLGFHYPAVRLPGYELTQFDMDLFAYNQESFEELQKIHFSMFPPVVSQGNRLITPKVSKIEYDHMTQRSLGLFVPIKPTTAFLYWDQEKMGYPCRITWLQYNPLQLVSVKQELMSTDEAPIGGGHKAPEDYPNFGNRSL
jgi:hypothetical protein